MAKSNPTVYATAVLNIFSNITSTPEFASTTTQLEDSDLLTKEKAIIALKKLGFSVTVVTNQMLSISASKKKFEHIFSTSITTEEHHKVFYFKAKNLLIPQTLQQLISAVVFAEPMELF